MLEITGKLRDRFIQAAVLLCIIDPVRGDSSTHGLDHDIHEIETPQERLLKKKFLDSFALLCAIRKDGASVSAACMEEGAPEGTVIRIASNAGVNQNTLSQLRCIVDVLNEVAGTGKCLWKEFSRLANAYSLRHVSCRTTSPTPNHST
jgi:hypothetical protein